jgi:hypothetical protein
MKSCWIGTAVPGGSSERGPQSDVAKTWDSEKRGSHSDKEERKKEAKHHPKRLHWTVASILGSL